jgi:hypothetical protein
MTKYKQFQDTGGTQTFVTTAVPFLLPRFPYSRDFVPLKPNSHMKQQFEKVFPFDSSV